MSVEIFGIIIYTQGELEQRISQATHPRIQEEVAPLLSEIEELRYDKSVLLAQNHQFAENKKVLDAEISQLKNELAELLAHQKVLDNENFQLAQEVNKTKELKQKKAAGRPSKTKQLQEGRA